MTDPDLQPLDPADGVEWYLDHRHDELRAATRRTHQSALTTFQTWTTENGITNLNQLSGRELIRFKTWRKDQSDLNTVSLNGTLGIIQCFLRFCEQIDAVDPGLAEKVPLPNVPPDEEVRHDAPDDNTVEEIQQYYRQFEYASRRHTAFELVAEIGLRLGSLRAIDRDDLDLIDRVIHLRHRPEDPDVYGTPLKNGAAGERIINTSPALTQVLEDYIHYHRHDITDDFDRSPLFTTEHGRVSMATIRRDFYTLTRPCEYGPTCPHDRPIPDCQATRSGNASKCPSSFSTHPLRKWAIMQQLDAGIPKEILSDRVDVSVPILDKHYDHRSQARKSKRRREELEAHLPQYAMTDGGWVNENREIE